MASRDREMPRAPEVGQYREALRGIPSEDRVWLDALKASAGNPDPAVLHQALSAAIRARCGEEAESIAAKLGPAPVRGTGAKRRWWLRPLAMGLGLAAILGTAPSILRKLALSVPTESERDALYFVLVDRYADGMTDEPGPVDRTDGQAWHGGDLQGVIDHLDDIGHTGAGAVWLSPVSDCRDEPHGPWGAYHGYWVEQIDAVDARFGSMKDLRALSDALHARGMKLYLDAVFNHVAPDGALTKAHPDWFHHNGDITDWDDPVQLVTHDVHGLPDLAQENDEVYRYLRAAALALVDAVQPDGFRVDAVRHLPPGFLAQLGDELRSTHPGFELVGEIFDGDAERVAERARQDRLDAVFDFPMAFALRDVFCDDAPVGRMASVIGADYGRARPVTLVDNHDLPRILSACHGDDPRAGQALAWMLTARGSPSITYGTEVGLEGEKEPDNRKDMVFGKDHPLGVVIREGLARRSASPALRSGESRVIGLSGRILTVARLGTDETVLVSVNRGPEPVAAPRWLALEGMPTASVVVTGTTTDTLARDLPSGSIRIERWTALPQTALPQTAQPPVTLAAVTLTIEVTRAPELALGDRLVLVGAGRNLGNWKPELGVPQGADGLFQLTVEDGQVLAFKLVVVHPDGQTDWEPHPDRFLLVSSARWSLDPGCGSACAPAHEGHARYKVTWADRALFDAISSGDAAKVSLQLEAGADPGAQDPRGRLALEAAVDQGQDQVVETLLGAGAAPSAGLMGRAVQVHNDRLLAILLGRGVPFDEPDESGQTPLMLAAGAGNREAVMRLKMLGADLGRKDAAGMTARDHAADAEVQGLLAP